LQKQPSHSSSISIPVRSAATNQASTLDVTTFQDRLNKAEDIVERNGNKLF
jgi:hypothetical protein